MNSLSKVGKDQVRIWENDYMVHRCPLGLVLLKVIIWESPLDTNATTSKIRTKLSSLDTYIETIGSDIVKFNSYIIHLLENLHAWGGTTEDLLENVFTGYFAASDPNFVAYINNKLPNGRHKDAAKYQQKKGAKERPNWMKHPPKKEDFVSQNNGIRRCGTTVALKLEASAVVCGESTN